MTRFPKPLHLCMLALFCLGAAPTLADEIADEPIAELGAAPAEPEPAPAPPAVEPSQDFESAEADWMDRRPWRYGTQHFFGLSRGLEDAGVPGLARPFLCVVTLPLDTIHLPIAAISGLFGD